MFVVQRYMTPNQAECSFTVVSCDADKLEHHRASAQPPKMKFQTCLELRAISFERLQDEAFWGVLCYTATAGSDGRLKPRELLYELLLSFLAENSLDQARDNERLRVRLMPHISMAARSHLTVSTATAKRTTVTMISAVAGYDLIRGDGGGGRRPPS